MTELNQVTALGLSLVFSSLSSLSHSFPVLSINIFLQLWVSFPCYRIVAASIFFGLPELGEKLNNELILARTVAISRLDFLNTPPYYLLIGTLLANRSHRSYLKFPHKNLPCPEVILAPA